MDASGADRSSADAREWPSLALGEWAVVGAAGVLLLALTAFDWFAFAVGTGDRVAPGSAGDAFRWLDGLDYVLVFAAVAALAAPLARFAGLVGAAPRDVAVLTGASGLIAALVIASVMVSPPDLELESLSGQGGGPTAHTITRGGAVLGLAAAIGIAAFSLLTFLASPAALAPVRKPRISAPVQAEPVPRQKLETPPPDAPPPTPKPKPRRRAAAPKPAPKRAAKPKPKPKRTPKPARPSLATATADDLVGVGFTRRQAERIVEYRDELGKVTKVADLKRVPGIAKPVLAELVKRLDE